MTKQGPRGIQRARYRDLVRPAVNIYNHRVSKTAAYRREFGGRPRGWGSRGAMPPDLVHLAQAARAASRGFFYARVSPKGSTFAVPIYSPV